MAAPKCTKYLHTVALKFSKYCMNTVCDIVHRRTSQMRLSKKNLRNNAARRDHENSQIKLFQWLSTPTQYLLYFKHI